MSDFVKILPYCVDLNETIQKTPLPTLFATEDNLAHCFELTIHKSGKVVDITGAEVIGYFIRSRDRETVRIKGDEKDGKVILTLEEDCYLLAGKFTLTIKISLNGVRMAVFMGEGGMTRSRTDVIVDKDRKVYGVEELLALIDEIEKAAEDAKDAVKVAEAWANATTSVTTLEPGSEATVNVQDVDGVRTIFFGIPQGIEGPQGPKGPQGPEGPQGASGKDFTIKGLYSTIEALQEAHPTGITGDAYAVGTSESNVVYIWDVDAGTWANLGALQGPAGPQGPEGQQGPIGETGPQGPDGPAGADGKDGQNGSDGKTPQRGTDYWTEEDKDEIVNDVLASLPVWEGGEY